MMTIADDEQKPIPSKQLTRSLDAIAALRAAMEQRLAQPAQPTQEFTSLQQPAPQTAAPQAEAPQTVAPQAEAPKVVEFATAEPQSESPKAEPQAKAHAQAQSQAQDRSKTIDPAEWPRITFRIADRVQRLMHDFMARQKDITPQIPALDSARIGDAFMQLAERVLKSPEHFAEAQLALWQGYMRLWQNMLARAQGKNAADIFPPASTDKRFKDQDWQNVWMFDFIKQSYLLTAEWVHGLVQREGQQLDPHLAHKIEFYTKQMIDAAAPSNFWMTNPEVLRTTLETGGENLVKGLENLLHDLERGHGMLKISMSSDEAFEVGKNIATTTGHVVFQNALMQLIQYAPTTAQVAKTPLLIIPPWINKFYILDLREKNSFIRYLVDQGHTVFCISWVNPDARHALTNFDDYMSEGALAALRAIKNITGEDDVNVTGYCIGGTLLASTLAYLNTVTPRPADMPNVASATYLVTMTDFSEPGDIGVFIDEEQIKALETRMAKKGYLDAEVMATTFNMLRSNDLIWSFVVNNYLLGKEPFPFDILYWNADSTNLPAVMHSYYLRKMYLANKLIEPNGLSMKNVPIDLRRITTPTFMISTQEDHIAPWKSTYAATQLYQGPVKFVLAGSGHIAGIVNPPAANKYSYWVNPERPADPEAWLKSAKQERGSWWPEWMGWLKDYAHGTVPARVVTNGIEPAPGSYVKVKAG